MCILNVHFVQSVHPRATLLSLTHHTLSMLGVKALTQLSKSAPGGQCQILMSWVRNFNFFMIISEVHCINQKGVMHRGSVCVLSSFLVELLSQHFANKVLNIHRKLAPKVCFTERFHGGRLHGKFATSEVGNPFIDRIYFEESQAILRFF